MATNIGKPLTPNDIVLAEDADFEVVLDDDEVDYTLADIVEDGEGGVIVSFPDPDDDTVEVGFSDNIMYLLDETELATLASELVEDFETDRKSREEWYRTYTRGLDLLGIRAEERNDPWKGACGVFHPMLIGAVIEFQAQAMAELFPAQGPARFKILGKETPEKLDQAQRVAAELNYQYTEKMTEARSEMDSLLFRLPLAGSCFKKVYFDPLRKRPTAVMVPGEDLVVNYGCTDLETTDRYTHVMKKSMIEVRKLQAEGFYDDRELPDPVPDTTDIEEKHDKIQGTRPTYGDDDRHTILEMNVIHRFPDEIDGGAYLPYIVTIEKASQRILAIRRNWYEGDEANKRRVHFTHYRYLPGMGFYGLGLIHIIGGLAKSATSLLRQLIDAGTLANLPGGLKAKGTRVKGDNTPIKPGEFRDIDVPGGTIKDSIAFLPYKEPSTVLHALLGDVVEEGRRLGSIAHADVTSLNGEAPVGTTLALLEQSLKVLSGVQARCHSALKTELRLVGQVIHDFMPSKYDYDPDSTFNRKEDFDGRVDIIPVSNPNASTMAQRVIAYQFALQQAQAFPQQFDTGLLNRQALETVDIPNADKIVKLPDEIKPMDPVSENMAILKQQPVKVFGYQDHEAHIQAHMAMVQDPKVQQMVGQSPFAGAIMNAMAAHITEHVAAQYRVEIQKTLGVAMPDENEPLPEDIERDLSRSVAEAASKLLGKHQKEEQQREAEEEAKNPLTQIQLKELEIKERKQKLEEMEAEHQALIDLEKIKQEAIKQQESTQLARERMRHDQKRDSANIVARIATQMDAAARREKTEGAKMGVEIAKEIRREAINVSDKSHGKPDT